MPCRQYAGSNHKLGIQPVAFGDGSVRNIGYLPYGAQWISDGDSYQSSLIVSYY